MLMSDAKPDPPEEIIDNKPNLITTNSKYKYRSQVSLVESSNKSKKILLKPDENIVINNSSNRNDNKINHVLNFKIVNSKGIRIGATTTNVFNSINLTNNSKDEFNTSNSEFSTQKKIPNFVQKLIISEKEITLQDMYVIKTHTGYGWRKIFLSLGYSNGQLDQFVENYKSKGIGEVIYQILLDWKCANGKAAYTGRIVERLWKYGEYDCVRKLRDVKFNQESL